MMYRRDFITKTLVAPLSLLTTHYPGALVAQSEEEYQRILRTGELRGETEDFFFLRDISWLFIRIRGRLGGPNGYEGSGWVTDARTAWSSAFPPFLGRHNADLENNEQVGAFNEMVATRENFAVSGTGRELADYLGGTYWNNRERFEEWCNEVGIIQGSLLFNSITSAQALFAIQYAMNNRDEFADDVTNGFSSSWVWPLC